MRRKTLPDYTSLIEWLSAQTQADLPVTFDQLEDVMGFPIPKQQRTAHSAWTQPGEPLGRGGDADWGAALSAFHRRCLDLHGARSEYTKETESFSEGN